MNVGDLPSSTDTKRDTAVDDDDGMRLRLSEKSLVRNDFRNEANELGARGRESKYVSQESGVRMTEIERESEGEREGERECVCVCVCDERNY